MRSQISAALRLVRITNGYRELTQSIALSRQISMLRVSDFSGTTCPTIGESRLAAVIAGSFDLRIEFYLDTVGASLDIDCVFVN